MFWARFRRSANGQAARFVPKCKQALALRRQPFLFSGSGGRAEAGKRRPKKQTSRPDRDALFYENHCITLIRIVKLNFHFSKNIFYASVFNDLLTPIFPKKNAFAEGLFLPVRPLLLLFPLEVNETTALTVC